MNSKMVKLEKFAHHLHLVYHITVPLIEKIDRYKNNSGNSSTTKVGKHIPSGFSVFTIPSFKCIENKHVYKGKDCMKKVL